ncbi:hypothetical protein LJE19_19335 [Planktothrix agardhii 1809]|nr:hypothetical protein [Planktothrix agardhii 1809]
MSNKFLLDFVVRSVYFSDLPNLKTAQTLMVQEFQKKTKKPQKKLDKPEAVFSFLGNSAIH